MDCQDPGFRRPGIIELLYRNPQTHKRRFGLRQEPVRGNEGTVKQEYLKRDPPFLRLGLPDVGNVELGYQYEWRVEQMANFGIPQSRRRLVLLAGREFSVAFPPQTHTRSPKPRSGLEPWKTVREAIGHMGAPVTLRTALQNGGPQSHNWHVVSELQAQTKERLRAAQPGQTWLKVDESLRPRCHQGGYSGFSNVYGRMAWDEASPTITGGCTTPCKGRFGHPDKRRYTISVREAALLQTFPENYRFMTDQIDAVCDLVGNAVPPLYAMLAGKKVLDARNSRRSQEHGARQ